MTSYMSRVPVTFRSGRAQSRKRWTSSGTMRSFPFKLSTMTGVARHEFVWVAKGTFQRRHIPKPGGGLRRNEIAGYAMPSRLGSRCMTYGRERTMTLMDMDMGVDTLAFEMKPQLAKALFIVSFKFQASSR